MYLSDVYTIFFVTIVGLVCCRSTWYRQLTYKNKTVNVPLYWSKDQVKVVAVKGILIPSRNLESSKILIDNSLSELDKHMLATIRVQRITDLIRLRDSDHQLIENTTHRTRRGVKVADNNFEPVQDLLCRPLANAVPVTLDTLSCDMQVDKLLDARVEEILKLSQQSITQEVEACLCTTRKISRCCGFYFWGTKRKWERSYQIDSDLSYCPIVCRNATRDVTKLYMYKTGSTDYSCYWPHDHCNEGVIYTGTIVKAMINIPGNTLYGSFIKGGSCDISQNNTCLGESGSLILINDNWESGLTPPKFETIRVDYIEDTDRRLMLIYHPVWGGNIINATCYYSFLGKDRIFGGLNGEYYIVPVLNDREEIDICSKITHSLNNPALKFGKMIESRSELAAQYRYCILTKLSVENGIKLGSQVPQDLLRGLTVRGDRNQAFFTLDKKLMALQCQPVEYDQLSYVRQNCYRALLQGITIGYMDATLGLMFRGGCVSNETSVSPTIGRNWVALRDGKITRAKRSTSPVTEYIKAMEEISNSSTLLLRRLYGDPFAGIYREVDYIVTKEIQRELGLDPIIAPNTTSIWERLSVLSKIGAIGGFSSIMIIAILILIICCRK